MPPEVTRVKIIRFSRWSRLDSNHDIRYALSVDVGGREFSLPEDYYSHDEAKDRAEKYYPGVPVEF